MSNSGLILGNIITRYCVKVLGGDGTLDNGYLRSVPLPRVQLVSHMSVPLGTTTTALNRMLRLHCPRPAALPLFT